MHRTFGNFPIAADTSTSPSPRNDCQIVPASSIS